MNKDQKRFAAEHKEILEELGITVIPKVTLESLTNSAILEAIRRGDTTLDLPLREPITNSAVEVTITDISIKDTP